MTIEIGLSVMPFFPPASLAVWFSISCLTWLKSVNYFPSMWLNSAYSSSTTDCSYYCFLPSSVVLSVIRFKLSIRGHLVTIPLPRGRKSRPTILSKTELFPLDWAPTTTIYGSSIELRAFIIANALCSLIINGTSVSMPSEIALTCYLFIDDIICWVLKPVSVRSVSIE